MDFELRKWRPEDAQSISQYADNRKIADNLRNLFPHPYTIDDAKYYIRSCIENGDSEKICRAIVINGKAAGSIGIFRKEDVYCKSAELGYWLGEPFWNHGIMSRAIRQICRLAFEQLDIVRIYAEPFAENAGSRKALEKAGFTLEGVKKNSVYKNDRIQDSCIYALLK